MEGNKGGIPKILKLESFKSIPGLTFKLNNEILNHLTSCLKADIKPKLVVKDGNFSIKINDNLQFPCIKAPEYSNLDVYSSDFTLNNNYSFTGRITHKLTAITDSKQIEKINLTKNVKHLKLHPASPNNNHSSSTPATPLNFDPYLVNNSDSKSDIITKFLYFMALGPSTRDQLIKLLKFKPPLVDDFLYNFCQVYNPNDTFLIDDIFPNNKSVSDSNHYILKDKSYKDLRPWSWKYYSENERNLIINNINLALTRLGYSETHPLRKRIVENSTSESETLNSTSTKQFHGGLVSSSKKTSPFKKAQTESPKLIPTSGLNNTTSLNLNSNSNTTTTNKNIRKRQLSNNSSSSTSDDEVKRFKKDVYTSPSSANDDEEEYDELDRSKTNHYNNLIVKFRQKYEDYTQLYSQLQTNTSEFTPETKKSISKLFELHQLLQDWKKQLWNYSKVLKSKEDIKRLTKHKKQPVSSYKPIGQVVPEPTPRKQPVKPVLNY